MEVVGINHQEIALVERAIHGDGDAYGELYLMFLDPIYRYIYLRTGDTNDAEDLTEQVFLKAWQALPGYRQSGAPFASWLYRIAHNLIVDYHRRRKSTVSTPIDGREDHKIVADLMMPPSDCEQSITLSAAVTQLTEEQQQVIILRFVEGFSYTELAQTLKKSEGACRMIQNRALRALNHLLNFPQGS